jgi:hydroxymethylbilane synthase
LAKLIIINQFYFYLADYLVEIQNFYDKKMVLANKNCILIKFAFLNIQMDHKKIRIGTRGSDLAMWQARYTQAQLLEKSDVNSELVVIQTKGDKIQHLSFDKIEGKGFFTKELEDALLDHTIDLAVHSMKDMPTSSPEGLCLGAVSYREDCRDVLLINKNDYDNTQDLRLKQGAIVGTSSVRRKAQLLHINNLLEIKDLRGNVPTRIAKLRSGAYDAIVLAKAGINRLEISMDDIMVIDLHPVEFVPAPAQGVLVWQCRIEDLETRKILLSIHNPLVAECTNIERKVLQLMEGGCHIPLGVNCERDANGYFQVNAAYSSSPDKPLIKVRKSQSTSLNLAELVVEELLKYK